MATDGHLVSRRLLLVVTAVLLLLVLVPQPLTPPLGTSTSRARVISGLGLRPVLSATAGPCPVHDQQTMVWSVQTDTCYAVRSAGIQVTRLQSAQVFSDQAGGWDVRLGFEPQDAATFRRMTTRLMAEPGSRDQLAVVLHGPPGGHLLAAPAVVGQTDGYLDLYGGPTEDDATALLSAILH